MSRSGRCAAARRSMASSSTPRPRLYRYLTVLHEWLGKCEHHLVPRRRRRLLMGPGDSPGWATGSPDSQPLWNKARARRVRPQFAPFFFLPSRPGPAARVRERWTVRDARRRRHQLATPALGARRESGTDLPLSAPHLAASEAPHSCTLIRGRRPRRAGRLGRADFRLGLPRAPPRRCLRARAAPALAAAAARRQPTAGLTAGRHGLRCRRLKRAARRAGACRCLLRDACRVSRVAPLCFCTVGPNS